MASHVVVQVELPGDLKQFRFPKALDRRLHELLDKQDGQGYLSVAERREAEGLVELAEMLSLLRSRAERKAEQRRSRS
jgi:hypothetical protein